MNILIPDYINISDKCLEQLKLLGAKVYTDVPKSEKELIARIADAEIITANYVDITPDVIDAAPKLKYIIVPAVGYDWVDVNYASSKGIVVLNCPTFNSQAVAELAIGLMFTASRKIIEANKSLRSGEWQPASFVGVELAGKNLGLIGYGNIGKSVEKMAQGIGMKTAYINSSSSERDIDMLLAESDYICLCLQLNDKTKNIISADRLRLLKSTAILVNVSRGAVLDQPALIQLLDNRSIMAAGLDVYCDEPLAGVPGQQIAELANMPNVVGLPHIGYNTIEASERLSHELIANLKSCLAGQPINVVS